MCAEQPVRSSYHVDAAVLPVVDLVLPYDRTAVGPDLDPGEGVPVDVVALDQSPPVSEYVHAPLVTVEYSISPGGR